MFEKIQLAVDIAGLVPLHLTAMTWAVIPGALLSKIDARWILAMLALCVAAYIVRKTGSTDGLADVAQLGGGAVTLCPINQS